MAAEQLKMFLLFINRRKGIVKALTKDLEATVDKCKAVPCNAPYGERYLLWGNDDASYELRKEKELSEVSDEIELPAYMPQSVPLYFGGLQGLLWLKTIADYSQGWLVAYTVYMALGFTTEQRRQLLDKIERVRPLSDEVMKRYKDRCRRKVTGTDFLRHCDDRVAGNKHLSLCEAETCQFVTEIEWVQCAVCHSWFHLSCADVDLRGTRVLLTCSHCP